MNTVQNLKKDNKKLGFTHLETAEIVVNLNSLLANYQVFYHKLRTFHWNVEGPEFFELHEEFEKEYNKVQKHIDMVAERIRVFGIKPKFGLEKILEMANIQERVDKLTALEMVREVLKDFEILHSCMLDTLNSSLNTGDVATEQMITEFIRDLETRNWMFTSYLK